jgi:UDP-N-acetylmuramyl pentapeptide phosphotransferase/UDP-N-acetylglucosamine-1-phosphate transferase
LTLYALLAAILSFALVFWGEKGFLKVCSWYKIYDQPNDRSLHEKPIPRGGGVILIASIGIGVGLLTITEPITMHWPLLIGGMTLFGISIYEDYRRVPIKIRLPVQLAVSAWVVSQGLTFENLPLPAPLNPELGIWEIPLNILWIMAFMNFFNFMDGIDGYVTLHTVIIGIFFAFLSWGSFGGYLSLLIAASAAGFLKWNWQPAQIFMGETGAITLGFLFALLPHYFQGIEPSNCVLITGLVFWLFLADGAFTLLRRIIKGERIWEAHRSHFYQRLVISGLSHECVTLIGIGSTAFMIAVTLPAYLGIYTFWLPFGLGILLFLGLWAYTVKSEQSTSDKQA